ncbi:MAG: LysR substrate-binding domain-containing protein [Pseudobdellovibrio sp.]
MSLDLDLNRLGIFKVVASLGSFSKAAIQLKQPKSRISRNIMALEKELGVSLIYRTTRKFQLSSAGQDLFQKVLPHFNALENAVKAIESNENSVTGLIRLTVPNDIGIEWMGKYIYEFQQINPSCKIDLIVDNKNIDLVGEGIDLALRFGNLKDSTLKQKKIGYIQLRMFISPKLLHHYLPVQKITELENIPFISFKKNENKKILVKLTNQKNEVLLKLDSKFSSDNFFVNKQMAIQGAGFCFLPAFIVQNQIQNGDLIPILKEWSTERVPLYLLTPQQVAVTLRIKIFTEFLILKLKELGFQL